MIVTTESLNAFSILLQFFFSACNIINGDTYTCTVAIALKNEIKQLTEITGNESLQFKNSISRIQKRTEHYFSIYFIEFV